MIKDENCAYCMQGDLVAAFAYPVCEMKTSFLYVFKEQSKRGRCIVAHKKHVSELIDLTDEERNDFFADVANISTVAATSSEAAMTVTCFIFLYFIIK